LLSWLFGIILKGDISRPYNKNRVIVEILKKEIIHYAISKGMFYYKNKNKLYYPCSEDKRKVSWTSRYGKSSTRTVAKKIYAEQLKRNVYWHVAFNPDFIQLGKGNFFFRVLPSFVITEDGRNEVTKGLKEGTVITRLSYNKYNDSYLNTVLFWMEQLGDGGEIKINDYLIISSEPLKGETPVGIIYDIPSSEFRLELDDEIDFLEGSDEID